MPYALRDGGVHFPLSVTLGDINGILKNSVTENETATYSQTFLFVTFLEFPSSIVENHGR